MLPVVLLLLSSAIASPLAAPVETPEWISARVWPDDAGTPVAIAELYGEADPGLGAHRGVHTSILDGCWRQHAAHGGDLSLVFCADVRVKRNGKARARVRALSDPRPGLAACIDASLEAWPGVPGAPARGEVCRAVATNISREARGLWVQDPWATVNRAGLTHLDAAVPPIEVGRARAEDAVQLVADPVSGGLVRSSAPLGVRDRATSTARRLVTGQREALAQCWRDHAHWRLPPVPAAGEPWMAFTLEITVGPAGAESVVPGRTAPVTHADVARCVAVALDQGVPGEAGSHVVEVPIVVWGFESEPTTPESGSDAEAVPEPQ